MARTRAYAPSATPIKVPYPDAIVKLIKGINCKLDNILEALAGMSGGEGEQVTVVTRPPRSTNVNWGKVTISTNPTKIRSVNPLRLSVSIVNSGAASVFIGDDNIVTINSGTNPGYELLPNSEFNTDSFVGDIYGVVAAGTLDVTYWEEVEQ